VKYLLDTNVYLEAVRSEEKKTQFRRTFFPLLPATFLCSVVAYELYVNAQNRPTRSLVAEFIRPMERTGRVVAPTFEDWVAASAVVEAIEEKDRGWRSKLPALLNDILIALSCREAGMTLVTRNVRDFQRIQRVVPFRFVEPWPAQKT